MTITQSVKKYGTRKLMRRVSRSVPWIGGVIAIVAIGGAIRRKGLVGGVVHSVLDAIPFVGAAKNIVEAGRGRDFIRDRPVRTAGNPSTVRMTVTEIPLDRPS
jgi:hypothetical protein